MISVQGKTFTKNPGWSVPKMETFASNQNFIYLLFPQSWLTQTVLALAREHGGISGSQH